jgi:hypothetical protein
LLAVKAGLVVLQQALEQFVVQKQLGLVCAVPKHVRRRLLVLVLVEVTSAVLLRVDSYLQVLMVVVLMHVQLMSYPEYHLFKITSYSIKKALDSGLFYLIKLSCRITFWFSFKS